MIDPYAYETYAGREGETFRIVLDDRAVDSTLASVSLHPPTTMAGFSLIFVADGDVLPQAIYPLDHDELGVLEIFLVPIAKEGSSVSYQAVFTSAPGAAP